MENYDSIDWGEVKRKLKIWKLKARRGLHNFDQKYKVSQNFKRAVLFLALKAAASVSADGQVIVQKNASSSDRNLPKTELLAMATPDMAATMEMTWKKLNEYIDDRQRVFAEFLSQDLADNIEIVTEGKKRGRKSATLRELFGGVNDKYYCSIGGLKTIENLSKKQDFFEYDFLLKCIQNPHSCPSVITGLTEFYGERCQTNNIRKTLKDQQKQNPNSVFIVLLNSAQNSSSGKHFVIVTPEFAADSIAYVDGNPQMTVYGFNSEVIKNVDEYFVGTKNKGHVFNLTEMGRGNLVELFYSGKIRLEDIKSNKAEMVHYEPVSLDLTPKLPRVEIKRVTAKHKVR